MVFQRDVFLNEGGFQDIPRMQDTELTERLCRHGYELYFTPDVVGLQTQDSSISKVLRKIYINGQNLYFIRYADSPRMKKVALVLSLPLLSALKVSRIVLRHLRYQTVKNKLVTLAIAPLLYLGGLYWMLGLYRSLLFGGAIHDKRD
jgi:GT2 family glycosyltransferase